MPGHARRRFLPEPNQGPLGAPVRAATSATLAQPGTRNRFELDR